LETQIKTDSLNIHLLYYKTTNISTCTEELTLQMCMNIVIRTDHALGSCYS